MIPPLPLHAVCAYTSAIAPVGLPAVLQMSDDALEHFASQDLFICLHNV